MPYTAIYTRFAAKKGPCNEVVSIILWFNSTLFPYEMVRTKLSMKSFFLQCPFLKEFGGARKQSNEHTPSKAFPKKMQNHKPSRPPFMEEYMLRGSGVSILATPHRAACHPVAAFQKQHKTNAYKIFE